MQASRGQVWLDGTGDWSWPEAGDGSVSDGQGTATVMELAPPAWVPAVPRLEPGVALAGGAGPAGSAGSVGGIPRGRRAGGVRRLASSAMLVALAIACGTLAVESHPALERLLGLGSPVRPAGTVVAGERPAPASAAATARVEPVSSDGAGSSIDSGSFPSRALHREGSFLLYLPPGFARVDRRYPVLYLLHGTDETDSSFLQIGLQGTLDRLISRHEIPPLIAVMIQGGSGTNNWLNHGTDGYESYVLETQELVDRTLPTVATRGGRAIAGYSMGGYGAMHLALAHPQRFAAVESWLGFFNGLEALALADHGTFSRLGLQVFVYGGAEDEIANPAENGPFAATLRADGARAHSAVYAGEHDLGTLARHLPKMLAFAGRALAGSGEGAGAGWARG